MKSGKHGFLAIGSLPKGASYIRRCIGALRREVEAAVLEVKGELSLHDAALAQSVARHEGRVLLAIRWLRERSETMSDGDRLSYLREIGNATDARDRALRSLASKRRTLTRTNSLSHARNLRLTRQLSYRWDVVMRANDPPPKPTWTAFDAKAASEGAAINRAIGYRPSRPPGGKRHCQRPAKKR